MTQKNPLKILLGVTGGIAAYKTPALVRLLTKEGYEVKVVMTQSSKKFVTPLTLQTVSRNKVYIDVFETGTEIEHVDIAKWADLMLIAPATANIIGKITHGIADDMVSTAFLAFNGQVILAPGMNTNMWNNPATQQNISILKQRGVQIIGPASGYLACGEIGAGRMSEPEEIIKYIKEITLKNINDFMGLKLLITGGPTREFIDPVRYISNPASGKTALEIALQGAKRGANITLVLGPTYLPNPIHSNIKTIRIETAQEMASVVLKHLFDHDALIMSAAVADWTPVKKKNQKIKKETLGAHLTLELKRTPDILRQASNLRGKQKKPFLLGFAAETAEEQTLIDLAKKKMENKKCDAILANDVSNGGFFNDFNKLYWIDRKEIKDLGEHHKNLLAKVILDTLRNKINEKK